MLRNIFASAALVLGPWLTTTALATPPTEADFAGRSYLRTAGDADGWAGPCPAQATSVWSFSGDGTFGGRCDAGTWTLTGNQLVLSFTPGPALRATNASGTVICTDQTSRQEAFEVAGLPGGAIEAQPAVGARQIWLRCATDPGTRPAAAGSSGVSDQTPQ